MASQDYQLLQTVVADGGIPITHHKNNVTGLQIFNAYVESPIVKGNMVFATEAFDDDGLPHTLEHLIYLGSEDYPYKGILDKFANICLADGTNASTDTDHTSYELCTAGADGFLKLLPVYLEHILFPTLTDSAYTTEVHHIDGNGDDAGVVYCEMQSIENTGDELCFKEMCKKLYPGRCGYKSNTGGALKNLRESTSNKKVRDYHAQFYHTKNLCIIVTGPVKPQQVFDAIRLVEDKVVSRGRHKVPFERPWQSLVPPMEKSCSQLVEYPAESDDDGIVYIGFRGPTVDDFEDLVALFSLLDYLNLSSISPIQKAFVECDEPYCSGVSHGIVQNSTSFFFLAFDSVGKRYMNLVERKLNQLLNDIKSEKEEFDDDRMKTLLSRRIVRILSTSESTPHSSVSGSLIGHFLYGDTNLAERCQEIPYLKKFAQLDKNFWFDILEKYMIGPNSRHVTVVGQPSPKKMKESMENEKLRLQTQKEKLKDVLPEYAKKLQDSVEENERPVPDSLIISLEAASMDNICYHSIERNVLDSKALPYRFHYDSVKTNFINIQIFLNSSHCLEKQDRFYLPLLSEIIVECNVKRDSNVISHQDVIAELLSDTVNYSASIGSEGGSLYSIGQISMLFVLYMQVELHKFDKAIRWLNELLFKSIFTADRVKAIATRMHGDISQYKRSGNKVASAASNAIIYSKNSNQWAATFLRQRKFLKNVMDKPEVAAENLTRIRNCLTSLKNIMVHVAADKTKLDMTKIHEPWINFYPVESLDGDNQSILQSDDIILPAKLFCHEPEYRATIIGLGSVEGSFLYQTTKSINCPNHKDLPAVHVLIEYLSMLEGPMWRKLRGLGLTYSYGISVLPSDGFATVYLIKSAQLVSAYYKAKEIIIDYSNGKEQFDEYSLKCAKSILMFNIIKNERNPYKKSSQSIQAYLHQLSPDYNQELIKGISKVTLDDVRRVAPIYLPSLYDDDQKRIAICCNSSKIDQIIEDFKEHGDDCLTKISIDDPFLNDIS